MAERKRYTQFLHRVILHLFVLAVFMLPVVTAVAQCPMCRMSAEKSNVRSGLNTGILYLLFAPIVLVGGAYAYWYYNKGQFSNED